LNCSSNSNFSGASKFVQSLDVINGSYNTTINSGNISLTSGNIITISSVINTNFVGNVNINNLNIATQLAVNGNTLLSGSLIANGNVYSKIFTSLPTITTGSIDGSGNGAIYTASKVDVGIDSNISIGAISTNGVITRNTIYIGNYTQLVGTNRGSRIIIGGPNDIVDFYSVPNVISNANITYTTSNIVLNTGANKSASSGGAGIQISDNTTGKDASGNDVSQNIVGYFQISNDMKAWNLKVPFGTTIDSSNSNVVGIRVNELINRNTTKNGLLILTDGINNIDPPQNSNYNITNSNLDISNIFIKDIDISSGLQSVSTDVSMNGNLFVSNVCIGMDNSNNYSNSLQVNGNIYQTTTYSNGFIMQF
jgi:hypothetical protein